MRLAAVLALLLLVPAAAQDAPLSGRALIDHHVRAKCDEIGLRPAGASSDAEFLRRVHLDLVGTIPSAEAADRFIADRATDKRAKLVDELMASDGFAENWGAIWTRALMSGGPTGEKRYGDTGRIAAAVRDRVAKNVPLDQFAREIITATGKWEMSPQDKGMMQMSEDVDGLALFWFAAQGRAGRDFPLAISQKFTRLFMGIQITCAQCHDHPFDRWTQDDAYAMGAFFTQVSVQRTGGKTREEKVVLEIADRSMQRGGKGQGAGLLIPDAGQPADDARRKVTGRVVKPSWLGSRETPAADATLRAEFARMLTSRSNVQFARAAVNRYWAFLFGRGIVNPPDDFSGKNKPSHPELLEALAADFVAHGYDVKWLVREIASSQAYQRSSASGDRMGERQFALAAVRALTPEQILNALAEATGVTYATQERDRIVQQFRTVFGDDEGTELVEFQGTITAALMMMNGDIVTRATGGSAAGMKGKRPADGRMPAGRTSARLAEILKKHVPAEERVRAIFLTVLTRPPTERELSRHTEYVIENGEGGYADVMWALLNSSEFLFQH